MKLVFVHDGPVFVDKNGNYYEYALHGLYERYSYLADDITFLIRVVPLTDETNNTPIPKEVNIVRMPDFKHLNSYIGHRKKAARIMDKTIRMADIVILRSCSSSIIAQKYVEKYKKPYIYECVDCAWDAYWNHSLLGKFVAPIIELQTKIALKKAKYAYYVTNQFLQKRYPTKGKSIGCSNVYIEFESGVLEHRVKHIKEMTSSGRIILGTAAALDVRSKGQEHVIRIISELVKNGYDVEYRLAGGNRLNSTFLKDLVLKYGIEDRVVFCGSFSKDEMIEFYDKVDIYIQPSKQEGLPRSVIEAMSRGCLCLGSDLAGMPELIEKRFLFKKGSDKAVYNAVIRGIEADKEKVARRNINKSKEYTIDKLTKKRQDFYDDFMKYEFRDKMNV